MEVRSYPARYSKIQSCVLRTENRSDCIGLVLLREYQIVIHDKDGKQVLRVIVMSRKKLNGFYKRYTESLLKEIKMV